MRYELRLHRLLLAILITLLTLFVLALLYLDSDTANGRLEAITSLAMVLVVATVFAYMGAAEGVVAFYFGLKHPRELVSYLLLGMLSDRKSVV